MQRRGLPRIPNDPWPDRSASVCDPPTSKAVNILNASPRIGNLQRPVGYEDRNDKHPSTRAGYLQQQRHPTQYNTAWHDFPSRPSPAAASSQRKEDPLFDIRISNLDPDLSDVDIETCLDAHCHGSFQLKILSVPLRKVAYLAFAEGVAGWRVRALLDGMWLGRQQVRVEWNPMGFSGVWD